MPEGTLSYKFNDYMNRHSKQNILYKPSEISFMHKNKMRRDVKIRRGLSFLQFFFFLYSSRLFYNQIVILSEIYLSVKSPIQKKCLSNLFLRYFQLVPKLYWGYTWFFPNWFGFKENPFPGIYPFFYTFINPTNNQISIHVFYSVIKFT